MKRDMTKSLSKTFCNIIEKLAFMFGEPVDKIDLPASEGQEYVRAEMAYNGPLAGSLAIMMPRDLCPEIAANVLGAERFDSTAAEHANDALKELLNVICGNILTAVAGEEPVFDLSVPSVSTADEIGWDDFLKRPETVAFLIDGTPVLLCFEVTGDSP